MGAVILAFTSAVGCDLAEPGQHGTRGGISSCVANSNHLLHYSAPYHLFQSETHDYPDSGCVSVGAQLVFKAYDGYLYVTGWDFGTQYASHIIDAVSSPKSVHQVCLASTYCAGGEN